MKKEIIRKIEIVNQPIATSEIKIESFIDLGIKHLKCEKFNIKNLNYIIPPLHHGIVSYAVGEVIEKGYKCVEYFGEMRKEPVESFWVFQSLNNKTQILSGIYYIVNKKDSKRLIVRCDFNIKRHEAAYIDIYFEKENIEEATKLLEKVKKEIKEQKRLRLDVDGNILSEISGYNWVFGIDNPPTINIFNEVSRDLLEKKERDE